MRNKWTLLSLGLLGVAATVMAEETTVPLSEFRKYFWGARQAYEDRHFEEAGKLLKTYQDRGSPSDRLMKLAGCDPKWEVSVFTEALKEARACLARRSDSFYWTDPVEAKAAVLKILQSQDITVLEPYVDCAPADLVPMSTTCGAHAYRKPADLERLGEALHKTPDIVKQSAWREFPDVPDDPQRIRWMLYSSSDHWQPCGMPGSPIISLRQDLSGQIRIAGFAVSCLEPASQ